MTSATEKLRRLLDERGAHWREGEDERKTLWKSNGLTWEYVNTEDGYARLGFLGACEVDITPEQAIAATLGSNEPPYDELLHCLENDWHISASWDGLRKLWCIELTEDGVQLRDATHGTLTAEQVREAVFSGSVYASYDGAQYYASGIDMQAIADELSARTCDQCERTCHDTWDTELTGRLRFQCSECGAVSLEITPRHCPSCGAEVVEG